MKERGGVPYFDNLSIQRANILYDFIDNSSGLSLTVNLISDE